METNKCKYVILMSTYIYIKKNVYLLWEYLGGEVNHFYTSRSVRLKYLCKIKIPDTGM